MGMRKVVRKLSCSPISVSCGIISELASCRFFDQIRLKPTCSATETSENIAILPEASLDILLPNKRITKVLIRLCGCTDQYAQAGLHFCCSHATKLGFLTARPS